MQETTTRRTGNRLTAALVRSPLEPGKYHDSGGMGLYLMVKPNGSRFWVQRIMIHGKRRELGLGSPPVVTLAKAREIALENKRSVRDGVDPLKARMEAEAIPTFAEAAHTVHKLHLPTWRNEKHGQQFISTLETYAFPRIGKMKVGDVSTADVLAVLAPIWNEKRETARRTKQRIGMVMKWAVAKGWRQDDPSMAITQALPKDKQEKVHRKALPYGEVATCMKVVESSGAGVSTKLAFRLLVLTASRSNEVRLARWGQVNWNAEGGPVWTRPADVMKAKKPHSIPLSKAGAEVLKLAKEISNSDDPDALIFPGTVKGKPLSDATLLKLVRENGYDIDIHGFRTSFRTWTQEKTTFPREVAEAALAHTIKDKAEAAYARSELMDKRRALGEAWAMYLAQESAKVVRIG
ncbi:integrase arm-type DNA-binding domain-containing protein [Paracoccus sp. MBLB3053]|uniref:Integrase arm-type DNA-binding domain-containing protein n=1 Tax=Paracoccus aurantius TaxID=3073814 RepID=A0ABU2HT69_9RHOB|nr:integrase arm-type DNA-binding domain-containing protein [Paracoccus sp. MBLB3053]MDS9467927.1 integrase arm-type DNA-binding domain-containing protein [Paracoccus sp. MBLB3053]